MKFIDKILIWLGKHIASGDNYLYIGSILIQWGSTGYPFTSKTAVNKNITFGKSYASAPLVFTADVSTQNFPSLAAFLARDTTKSSTTIRIENSYNGGNAITVAWLAIGKFPNGEGVL